MNEKKNKTKRSMTPVVRKEGFLRYTGTQTLLDLRKTKFGQKDTERKAYDQKERCQNISSAVEQRASNLLSSTGNM